MHNDLKELLTVMRSMNNAALRADWTELEQLDHQRQTILDQLNEHTLESSKACSDTIMELVKLDQAVLSLTKQGLENIAREINTSHRQSQACLHYQYLASNS